MTASLEQLQRWALSPNPLVRRMVVWSALVVGALAITLLVGVAGPLAALALGVALVGGALILADTHWGFVALAAVLFGLPFASLPFSIGFKPTFLDLALGALFFVWVFKLAIGKERRFIASPVGGFVAAFMALAVFSFALGLVHSPANQFIVRRFAEILLGIALFFVTVNSVRTEDEVLWITRWLLLAGWGAALLAVIFYVIPVDWTVAILNRLARFDYPAGAGALRYIEDDPEGTLRAIGTAVDPNVLGGMMILVGGLVAPQVVARERTIPAWLAWIMMGTAALAIYLTYSRSALLGLAASVGLLAVVKYRRLLLVGLLGLLLLFLLPQTQAYVDRLLAGFTGQDLATQMRFGEYKDALRLIRRYPVFGVGFTGVPDIDLYLGVSMVYLIIAQNMGLVGLGAYLMVAASFFVICIRAWRQEVSGRLEPILLGLVGAVLGALVSGVFDHYWFNMTYPHMTVLFWLYLGMATATVLVVHEPDGPDALDQTRHRASVWSSVARKR